MKKSLSVLVAGAMVSSLFASVALAEDITIEQKYQALIAAGIFDADGTGNGSELDANMSREQLAKILAKLLNLEEVSGTSYTDVAADRWSAGFIQAVSKATPFLMDGTAPGVFNPAGEVTLEQLATVATRALGLEVDNNAAVSGNVSGWAQGYVAAAIAAGVLPVQSDYTRNAIRSELVFASYEAAQIIASAKVTKVEALSGTKIAVTFDDGVTEEYELETALEAGKETTVQITYKDRTYNVSVTYNAPAVSLSAVGAKKLEVKFNKAVDDTKATFAVKKGTIPVNYSKVTWSDDKTTATIETIANLTKGEYAVTVGGVVDPAVEQKVTVEDQKVTKIEFASENAPLGRNDNTTISTNVKVFNQYNENVTDTARNELTVTASRGNLSNPAVDSDGTLTMTAPSAGEYQLNEKVAVSVVHAQSGTFASQVLTVSPKSQVANITIKELWNKDGKTLEADNNDAVNAFYLLVDLKDQYGNNVKVNDANSDVLITSSNPSVVKADSNSVFSTQNSSAALQVLAPNAGYKAGTSQISIISTTTGNRATYDVVVKDVSKVDTLSLSAPDFAVAGEKIEIPFSAVDQFGNEITYNAASLNGTGMISPLSVAISGVTPSTPAVAVTFEDDLATKQTKLILNLEGKTVTSATTAFINGVTSTGKHVQLNLTIQPNAKPQVITGVTDLKQALVVGATTTIAYNKINVLDQYGRTKTANTFGNQIDIALNNANVTSSATSLTTGSATLTADAAGQTVVTLTINGVTASEYTTTLRVVAQSAVTGYEVADIAKLYAQPTNSVAYNKAITVNGLLADGTKVAVPTGAYTVTTNVYNNTGLDVTPTSIGANSNFEGAANSEKTILVTVIGVTGSGSSIVTKEVVVSKVPPQPETLSLRTGTVGTLASGIIQVPQNAANAAGSAETIANDVIKVVDQYGVELTASSYIVNAIPSTQSTSKAVGSDYTITAITSNGKVITFTVRVSN